jgi:glycopeptide antibiotics resistance protein
MKTCPTCKRNLDKTLHNTSEVVAGIGVLIIFIPILTLLYIWDYKIIVAIIIIGLGVLIGSCIVHLWSEVRVKQYR